MVTGRRGVVAAKEILLGSTERVVLAHSAPMEMDERARIVLDHSSIAVYETIILSEKHVSVVITAKSINDSRLHT